MTTRLQTPKKTITRQWWTRLHEGGQEGVGAAVDDDAINISTMVVTTMITLNQRSQNTLRPRAVVVVALSRWQPSSAEFLVVADVTGGRGGGGGGGVAAARVDKRKDCRWGATRGEKEGGGVVVAVSPVLKTPDRLSSWQLGRGGRNSRLRVH